MAGDTLNRPTSTNFELLPSSPTCSASKSSAVAEVRDELGRAAVRVAHDADAVGAVRLALRRLLRSESIETIPTGILLV